jgi:hypothetical protein
MWILIAALVVLAVILPLALFFGRAGRLVDLELPWSLPEAANRQVVILGGLSGFAFTAIVLLVTFARDRADAQTDAFNALASMLLVAYLMFVGTAITFAFLPQQDPDGGRPARIQFALATLMHYRAILLGWFALRPLMQTFALDELADVAGWAVGASLTFGSVLAISLFYRLGVLNSRETLLLPLLSGAASIALAAIFALFPDLRSPSSRLYLTAGLYGLNLITYTTYALGIMAGGVQRLEVIGAKYYRRVTIADMQASMLLLTLVWLATMGVF